MVPSLLVWTLWLQILAILAYVGCWRPLSWCSLLERALSRFRNVVWFMVSCALIIVGYVTKRRHYQQIAQSNWKGGLGSAQWQSDLSLQLAADRMFTFDNRASALRCGLLGSEHKVSIRGGATTGMGPDALRAVCHTLTKLSVYKSASHSTKSSRSGCAHVSMWCIMKRVCDKSLLSDEISATFPLQKRWLWY